MRETRFLARFSLCVYHFLSLLVFTREYVNQIALVKVTESAIVSRETLDSIVRSGHRLQYALQYVLLDVLQDAPLDALSSF